MPELELNRDTIQFIIDKAREIHAKEGVTFPETPLSPTDDWAMQVLADHADDASLQEFGNTIDDLDPDQQVALVALMWLGRGDFDDWDEALQQAGDSWNKRTSEYLAGSPLVADYLTAGLAYFDPADRSDE